MRTLLLVRHAKTLPAKPGQADYDRTLAERGEIEAPRLGRLLREIGVQPDVVLTSGAARARRTAELLLDAAGLDVPLEIDDRVYHGEPSEIVAAVAAQPDTRHRVLLVGHNPHLEELFRAWSGDTRDLPTAAMAHLVLRLQCWSQLRPGTPGDCLNFWVARELEDESLPSSR